MKRFLVPTTLAFLALAAAAASSLGDEPSANGPGGFAHARRGHGLHRLEKCLTTLDLSSEQQAAIPAILASGKETLRSSAAAFQADRRKLRADLANGAEKSVLGQDVLDQEASKKRLTGDALAVRAQIEAKLSPDQLAALGDCARPRGGRNQSSGTAQ
jgi:Spy/CpxP family protein refolding chaperone